MDEKQVIANGAQIIPIQEIIKANNYTSYLEIGVQHGVTFFNVNCHRRVSVDPSITDALVQNKLVYTEIYKMMNHKEPNIEFYVMTSDDYFKSHAGEKFDMIFVDGLHMKTQAYNDIINSLTMLNEGGTIVVHDVNPPSADTAIPEEAARFNQAVWCGDVWKAIVMLRVDRPDLEIYTLPAFPVGLTVIKRSATPQVTLDPKYLTYEYEDFAKERDFILNMRHE